MARIVSVPPDGSLHAVARWLGVWLYDTSTFGAVGLLTGHVRRVSSVEFSPDGTLLASSWEETVKICDADLRHEIAALYGHACGVDSIAFSPDGTILPSGSADTAVKPWHIDKRQEIVTCEGHARAV